MLPFTCQCIKADESLRVSLRPYTWPNSWRIVLSHMSLHVESGEITTTAAAIQPPERKNGCVTAAMVLRGSSPTKTSTPKSGRLIFPFATPTSSSQLPSTTFTPARSPICWAEAVIWMRVHSGVVGEMISRMVSPPQWPKGPAPVGGRAKLGVVIGLGAQPPMTKPKTRSKVAKKRPKVTDCTTMPTVLLSIDPGRTSGWAIWLNGDLHSSGVVKNALGRREVVDTAWDLVEKPQEIQVAFEKCAHGSNPTVYGMGKSEGRWLEELELSCVPEKNVTRYTASQWRRRLWGSIRMPGNKQQRRAGWKIQALTWAETYCGVKAATDDEAEALCMGEAHLLQSRPS
jgi:hypothetical protein